MKLTKFLLTFSIIAALGVSCSDNEKGGGDEPVSGTVTISTTKSAIKSDGTDFCEFIVKNDGVVVTEGVSIYQGDSQTPLSSLKFSTTAEGTYTFYASYGTSVSKEKITVVALSIIPQLPADPQPANTSFSHRVLAMQMTGTGCPNCPYMTVAIRQILGNAADAQKVFFVGAHGYNQSDPMQTATTAAITQAYGNGAFPAVSTNMRKDKIAGAYSDPTMTRNEVMKLVNAEYNREVKAGVSAAVEKGTDKIIITAGVKAAEAGNYRVGAWVLEDGIVATQANNGVQGDFNTHDNVVRDVAGRPAKRDFTGDMVGSMAAAEVREHVMTIEINPKWNLDNCKVLVFVSTPDMAEGSDYFVTNCILCDIDATTSFTYK